MVYLITYFLLGLFIFPWYVVQTKSIKGAILSTLFGYPLWPFMFAYTLWTALHTWEIRCTYCGEMFVSSNRDKDIIEHIKVCEKHPMRKENERLQARIVELEQIKQEHESELVSKTVDLEEAQERIAELEAERRWIPASEPPNEDGTYDTFGYWGEFFYAEYKSGQWSVQGVTHWRNLPKPPEIEE